MVCDYHPNVHNVNSAPYSKVSDLHLQINGRENGLTVEDNVVGSNDASGWVDTELLNAVTSAESKHPSLIIALVKTEDLHFTRLTI